MAPHYKPLATKETEYPPPPTTTTATTPSPPSSLPLAITQRFLRRIFALTVVSCLLLASLCHLSKSYDSHHRKASAGKLIYPPRMSDMNEHFTGYGGDHDEGSLPDDLQFGLDSHNLAQKLGVTEEDSMDLMLDGKETGTNVWNTDGENVFADPPKRLDGKVPNRDTPPGNMLVRPVHARSPHPPDPKHPNVCLGPPKFQWNGPEEFEVDPDQFERIYMLSKSPYVRARFRITEGGKDKDIDKILIRPKIRLNEAEMNNILEVSQVRNVTRKSYVFRLATPTWDESGNGRFNCIFADIHVILPKSLRSLPLLGAGAVNGGVWFGRISDNLSIATLVGWAGQGHVRLKLVPNVNKVIVAVKNGIIDGNYIGASAAVKMKIVNGPVKVGISPLAKTEGKLARGRSDNDDDDNDEGLSIRLRSVNGAVNANVDESFRGTFVAETVNGIVKVKGERLNFDRHELRFASGTHGDVSSPPTMSINAHALNGPVFIVFVPLSLWFHPK